MRDMTHFPKLPYYSLRLKRSFCQRKIFSKPFIHDALIKSIKKWCLPNSCSKRERTMPAAGIALLPLFRDSILAIIRPLFHFIHVIVAFFPIAGSVNPSNIFPSPASWKRLSLLLCLVATSWFNCQPIHHDSNNNLFHEIWMPSQLWPLKDTD